MSHRSGRDEMNERPQPAPSGDSWFLGIGIDAYQHFTPLRNAVRDAEAVSELLIAEYDLEREHCLLLFNEEATRNNIISKLEYLADHLKEEDKLLIYYSGHGHLDARKKGFWVPVDAQKGSVAEYIRNSTIREYIGDIGARHILLISDSCFSGSLFVRSAMRSEVVEEELESIPSRWAICSGRHNEEVADGRAGGHSPFADSILTELRRNRAAALRVGKLASRVVELTRANYEQLPEGNPLQNVGHKGGQYIFRRRESEDGFWERTQKDNTVAATIAYLNKYPAGKYRSDARTLLREQEDEAAWQKAKRRGTYSAWLDYADDFPDGKYITQARAKMQGNTPPPKPRPTPPKPRPIADKKPAASGHPSHPTPDAPGPYRRYALLATAGLLLALLAIWGLRQCNSSPGEVTVPPVMTDSLTQTGDSLPAPPSEATTLEVTPPGTAQPEAPTSETNKPKDSPPPDRDGDGVVDSKDRCPDQRGTAAHQGCPPPAPAPTPKTKYQEPKMKRVAGGTFIMGCKDGRDTDCSSDEKPAHKVSISTFYIGVYEVTNAEFALFLTAAGNKTEGEKKWYDIDSQYATIKRSGQVFTPKQGYEDHPVMKVSWYGARAYAKWLSQQSGKTYRLPTEAEWEFAARGGNNSRGYKYAGSNTLEAVGWYSSNSGGGTQQVGKKKGNELGLYDMSGNVWEWCSDWHAREYYQSSPVNNPKGAGNGSFRVLRGGGWDVTPEFCRAALRSGDRPRGRKVSVGFRLVRS